MNQWRAIIRQLVTANYLRVDIEGYGGLQLTSDCGPVLRGEKPIQFRKDPEPERATRGKGKAGGGKNNLIEEHAQPLFDALRDLRLQLARQQGIPPYIIFHDSTLVALSQSRPNSLKTFGQMPGVGTVKLNRYGEAFLSVINASKD